MDTSEAAIEAEVELDGEGLGKYEARNSVRRGQKAVEVAKGGIDIPIRPSKGSGNDGEADESSRLLPPGAHEDEDGEEEEDRSPPWHGMDEFRHLPAWRRPNIIWVLVPFFLMACAFGGVITPKLNLILELVCQRYMSERAILDPGFTMIPVDFHGGDNDQCRIPEVQEQVAKFSLFASLIGGILSAITSPKLGALSDRYGRKIILVLTSIGTIAGEVITIAAATFPERFPVNLLLLGYAIDGLTGSFIVAMAIANSYAADCTPPQGRNVAFGFFHGALFSGIAIGPIIAGYIVKRTGQIVTVFYILLVVHIFFLFFVSVCVPESLSKKRMDEAREKHDQERQRYGVAHEFLPEWMRGLESWNLLEPLKVLWPTGPGSTPALRRNLFLLAAIDTIVFGVAMGSITIVVVYTNYMFGWKSFESGRFMTIVNSSRVFCLLILLPVLTRYFRPKREGSEKHKHRGSDTFDLTMIRISVFFDFLGYIGYALSRTGAMMTLSGATAAVGGIGSPTLQSALTKHIPPERTGQLLGASGLLHALARVVAPTIFNAIYFATVRTFPQAVFVCLASTFGLAFLLSWFLSTGVYFDEARAEEAAADPSSEQGEGEGGRVNRIPIVSSAMAMFGLAFAWIGISSS